MRALPRRHADARHTVASLAQAHAELFKGAHGLSGEQRLEWDEIYRNFKALYESQLEEFLSANQIELEAFVVACQEALETSSWQVRHAAAARLFWTAKAAPTAHGTSLYSVELPRHAELGHRFCAERLHSQEHKGLVSVVMAMSEYEYFINMMSDAAEQRGRKQEEAWVAKAIMQSQQQADAFDGAGGLGAGDSLEDDFM